MSDDSSYTVILLIVVIVVVWLYISNRTSAIAAAISGRQTIIMPASTNTSVIQDAKNAAANFSKWLIGPNPGGQGATVVAPPATTIGPNPLP